MNHALKMFSWVRPPRAKHGEGGHDSREQRDGGRGGGEVKTFVPAVLAKMGTSGAGSCAAGGAVTRQVHVTSHLDEMASGAGSCAAGGAVGASSRETWGREGSGGEGGRQRNDVASAQEVSAVAGKEVRGVGGEEVGEVVGRVVGSRGAVDGGWGAEAGKTLIGLDPRVGMLRLRRHAAICVSECAYQYVRTRTRAHAHMHVHMHTHVRTDVYSCTDAYARIHIRIQTQRH